jgi:hypothetical protein
MKWKGFATNRPCSNSRRNSGNCLEVLKKTTNNLSQDSLSPGRDLNADSYQYESGMLTTRVRRSVKSCQIQAVAGANL